MSGDTGGWIYFGLCCFTLGFLLGMHLMRKICDWNGCHSKQDKTSGE